MTVKIARGKSGTSEMNKALRATFTVATLPPAAAHTGRIVYVTNGAAGSPCVAVSNGTNWLRITLGAAVAAS